MISFKQYIVEQQDIDELTTGQLINKVKAQTTAKKKYNYAKDVLQQIWNRKKRHKRHDVAYYAQQIAKQVPGVDARTLADMITEGSESWEAGYKRRVVKATKPEHKEKGYNWRIKGKDRPGISIKLYKSKPDYAEFVRQMKRVAGHEFGSR